MKYGGETLMASLYLLSFLIISVILRLDAANRNKVCCRVCLESTCIQLLLSVTDRVPAMNGAGWDEPVAAVAWKELVSRHDAGRSRPAFRECVQLKPEPRRIDRPDNFVASPQHTGTGAERRSQRA